MNIPPLKTDYLMASDGIKALFTAGVIFGWVQPPEWVGYVFLVGAASCFLSMAMMHSADYLRGGRE